MQRRASSKDGNSVALILDEAGHQLRAADMMNMDRLPGTKQHKSGSQPFSPLAQLMAVLPKLRQKQKQNLTVVFKLLVQ